MRTVWAMLLALATIPTVPQPALAAWVPNGNPVCSAFNTQNAATLTSDGAGGVIIAWTDFRTGDTAFVYAQRLTASGLPLWAIDGLHVSTSIGGADEPQIISDGADSAIIVWSDSRSGGSQIDIYAQRINGPGVTQWTPGGVAICTAANYQLTPKMVGDGVGGAIITWYDWRNASHNDVYVQRVNSAGAVQWTGNGVPMCVAAGNQSSPTIASDGSSGAIVTWWDERSGAADIHAQRVSAAGAPLWTLDGVVVCGSLGEQYSPKPVSDGAGGAIIAWEDLRGDADVYAQRLNGSGAAQWAVDGVVLTGAGFQGACDADSDGSGGALVAWIDDRVSDSDVYVQRVNAAGVPQWTAQGVALCVATSAQSSVRVDSEGTGGAVLAWQDYRSGNGSVVYAQRVNALGVVQWASNGAAVSQELGDQYGADVLSDGANGAFVCWTDNRAPATDIYATRITAAPASVETPSGPRSRIACSAAPNPFRQGTQLRIDSADAAPVTVTIVDAGGRVVRVLTSPASSAGRHTIAFDGRDENGLVLPIGVYSYRATVAGSSATGRMVVLR